jgi:hypothetical protein
MRGFPVETLYSRGLFFELGGKVFPFGGEGGAAHTELV